MKMSELTLEFVKDFCGICDNDSDEMLEKILIPSAKNFVRGYTGLDDGEIDSHEDITIAVVVLVNDMFTNRDFSLYSAKSTAQVNPAVQTILGMYCKNLL